MNHRPKKSLGQNFLKNAGVVVKIVDAADLSASDVVLEIGPGLGVLTEKLLEKCGKVIAIEKDDSLISVLQEKFSQEISNGTLRIIHGDVLDFDPEILRSYFGNEKQAENKNTDEQSAAESLQDREARTSVLSGHDGRPEGHSAASDLAKIPRREDGAVALFGISKKENSLGIDAVHSYKIVANIPYYITGAIIEKFLSAKFQPNTMVLLVQKEVAERIVAKDKKTGGLGKESILSIAVKAYGNPYYISTVRAGSFVPAPSVDSAILKIENISRKHFKNAHHEQVFFQVVKTGFAHKRKTLAGNLKNSWEPEMVAGAIGAAGLRPAARAEDVHIDKWRILADVVYNAQYES